MTSSDSSLRLWPDNPTAVDLLGFGDIAAPVLEAIGRERLDPVAVGVFGDWGSGKTTILEVLAQELKESPDVVVVYTRPWEYDPALDVRASLIADILTVLRERAESDATRWARVQGMFLSLSKRVQWTKAITLASKTAITFSLPKLDDLLGVFSSAGSEADDRTLQGFRGEFATLMDALDDVTRVVVLVDDLDRCLPESVVMTLEAIKLFLSVKKMAFVIAADQRLVEMAIARHFDSSQQGGRMASDYLEKIIQIPVMVPALGVGDTEAYLALMLIDQHVDAATLAEITSHCDARRRAGEHLVYRDVPGALVPNEAAEDLVLAAELAPVLYERLDGNPRRLKRFLNAFWIRSDIARRRSVALVPTMLAKLMVLERIEPDAFGQLLDWLNSGALQENLKLLEEGKSLAVQPHGAFEWWVRMDPKVAGASLAPYLRLAASLRRRPGPRSDLRGDLADLLETLTTGSLVERNEAQARLLALPEGDRHVMARELLESIRTAPSTQENLGAPIGELLRDGTCGVEIADGLDRLDPSRVDAGLIITISEDGVASDRTWAIVRAWAESGRLGDVQQKVSDDLLAGS